MDKLRPLIPYLIPIVLLQLTLMFFALRDLIRRERTNGPKAMWVVVIVFLQFLGPILYFVLGRKD